MSIIRVEHNKNFVVMNKICLQDNRLSWKAKGVYAYLMSLPDNWQIKTNEVVKHSLDGKTSLLSALKELIDYGYCINIINRNEDGTIKDRDYILREEPQAIIDHQLDSENLNQVNLDQDSKFLLNNNGINIDFTEELNRDKSLLSKSIKASKKSSVKKKKEKKVKKFNPNSPGGKLAQLLLDEIEKHDPSFLTPNMGYWEACFNRMIFIDHYREKDLEDIIIYCQRIDEFWQSIILSPYVLKAKYFNIRMKFLQYKKKQNNRDIFEEAKRLRNEGL